MPKVKIKSPILIISLVILTWFILNHKAPLGFEVAFYNLLVTFTRPLSFVWVFISMVYPLALILVFKLLWNFWKDSRKDEFLLLILITSGTVISGILKKIIQRPCPPSEILTSQPTGAVWINQLLHKSILTVKTASDFCWPSGHVVTYTVLFGGVIILINKNIIKRQLLTGYLAFISWFLLVTIGLSRIFLGQHWLLDVVGGYLVGIVWLEVVFGWFWQRNKQ